VVLVETEEEMQEHLEVHDIVMVYFGYTSVFEYEKIYEIIAKRFDKAFFLRVEEGSPLERKYGVLGYPLPHAILLRKFEEMEAHEQLHFLRNWDARTLERWIVQKSVPTIFEFQQKHAYHIYVHKHPAVFFFRDKEKDDHRELEKKFYEIAEALSGDPRHEEVFFALASFENPAQQQVANTLGITKADYPLIALLHQHEKTTEKYILQVEDLKEELSYERLMEFLGHYKEGKLSRHLRAEDGKNEVVFQEQTSSYIIRGNKSLRSFIN